ncbi:MAG TPA: hypothetical protein VIN08_24975 [Ohtaekwangia sp.]|uniref:hypothetical protein n=1 Tax=Ohtaekwangia sp. TaxID=2066019 RepID=UPI002F9490BF
MRKITAFLVAMFMVSIAFVHAQQTDSTRNQQRPSQSSPSTEPTQSDQYKSGDFDEIESADVPASLRSTLQRTQYKGWESGKVYRSKNNSGYWVTIGTGSDTRNYYFDRNGRATKAPGPGVGKSPE